MWLGAQQRAKRSGIPFEITVEDIQIPAVCPVLGIPLERGDIFTQPNSPSLDRIRPGEGYTPGNIAVISHRANRMKNDATLDDLKRLVDWLQAQG